MALTGQSLEEALESLNRQAVTGDNSTTGQLAKNWDGEKLRKEAEANAQIMAAFGQQASKAVGNYAQKQIDQANDLRDRADKSQDAAERAGLIEQAEKLEGDWGRDGSMRLLAHSTIGALSGGAAGAAGAAAGTITSAQIGKALEENKELPQGLKDTLIGAAAVAAGSVAGNGAGGSAAYNEVVNNYLTLQQVLALNEELKGCGDSGGSASCEPVWEKYKKLEMAQQDQLEAECAANPGACSQKYAFLNNEIDATRNAFDATSGLLRWYEFGAGTTLGTMQMKQVGAWQQVGSSVVTGNLVQKGWSRENAELYALILSAGISGNVGVKGNITGTNKPNASTPSTGAAGAGQPKAPGTTNTNGLSASQQSAVNQLTKPGDQVITSSSHPIGQRVPQDVNVKPKAPDEKPYPGRIVGKNVNQNRQVQQDAAYLDSIGASDIRINQQQLQAGSPVGCRQGICRPDLQATLPDGRRIHIEYDTSSSNRGAGHAMPIDCLPMISMSLLF